MFAFMQLNPSVVSDRLLCLGYQLSSCIVDMHVATSGNVNNSIVVYGASCIISDGHSRAIRAMSC